MCGPDTPTVDGVPCGVFSWTPPPALTVELSELLDGGADRDRPGRPTSGDRPGDARLPARHRAARARSTRRACSTRPTCTSPPGSAGSAARPTSRSLLAAGAGRARGCGWARCASTSPRSTTPCSARATSSLDVSALPWPDPPAGWRRAGPEPLVADGADAPGGRPLRLVDGLLYLERYWRQEELVRARRWPSAPRRRRPRSTSRGCGPGWTALFRRDGGGPAAAGRGGGRAAAGHGARRRAGHRQDHHRRPAAGAAARPARPAAADRAGRADRKAAARLQEAVAAAAAGRAAGPRARRGHPAPAAGLAPGGAVPLRPRQAAALRRRGGRRDVDGVADDDGPAARRGAPAGPAGAGRRPRPAGLGRGRCGARRPRARRRARRTRARRRAGARSACPAAVRQRRRHAASTCGGSAARSPSSRGPCRPATPTPRSPCCAGGRRPRRWSSPSRTTLAAACARDVVAAGPRARRGGRGRRRRRRARRAGAAPGAVRAPARARTASPAGARRSSAGSPSHRAPPTTPWYPGRPVLVTANDYDTGLFNGDTGVVVATAGRPAGGVRPRRPAHALPAVPAGARWRPCTR